MNICVLGGGGFLGRYIIEQLIDSGYKNITSFTRSKQLELEALGIITVYGDLKNKEDVFKACKGQNLIIHTAAKAGVWGDRQDYFDINVTGTQNVIDACLEYKIKNLVYTSSPSIAYSADCDVCNMNENNPIPENHSSFYSETKAIAEKLVLDVNSSKLRTISLRPHLLWGPRDVHLIPRLIDGGKKNKLAIIGNGKNIVDLTYIENAAAAHLCAVKALLNNNEDAFGKAFFISDDNPVCLWKWIDDFFEEMEIPKIRKKISYKNAFRIGWILEKIYRGLHIKKEPPMTPFIAGQLAFSHYFDITRAKEILGYKAKYSNKEGIDKIKNA